MDILYNTLLKFLTELCLMPKKINETTAAHPTM